MKTKIAIFSGLFLIIGLLGSGCVNIAGGARPREHARTYLIDQGIDSEIVYRIIDKQKMTRAEFETYSKSPNKYVRVLISGNYFLPADIMWKLAKDSNSYVRGGVTSNRSITPEIIQYFLKKKESLDGLASNPTVSEKVLLEIYDKDKVSLNWFALNANCPDRIRKDILSSNDYNAKEWLKTIDKWKENGTYITGADGRWCWYDPETPYAK